MKQSINEGADWTDIQYDPPGTTDFPDTITQARVMSDGNLLVCGASNQKIYRSNSPALNAGFSEVLTLQAGSRIDSYWSLSVYGSTAYAGEYNVPNPSPKAYRSTDAGLTWQTIFTAPVRAGAHHIHHIQYDPYDELIWIVLGDGANRMVYYSRNGGLSWRQLYAYGAFTHNFVQIIPLPESVIFLTDSNLANGTGSYILRRRYGLPGEYEGLVFEFDPLGGAPSTGAPPTGATPAIVAGADACAYFGFTFYDLADDVLRSLWATRDGIAYSLLHTPDAPTVHADGNYGIKRVLGPYSGFLYVYYDKGGLGNFLAKVPEPAWS